MSKKEEIVVARMVNGDFVIGLKSPKKRKNETEFLHLDFPRILDFEDNDNGKLQVYSYLVCDPFNIKRLSEAIDISKSQIVFTIEESEIPDEVISGYSQILENLWKARQSEKNEKKEPPKVDKDFIEKIKKDFKL